tara:strand:- start:3380 stop:3748 length:369 start_codon:yes stop_codon:yes gene_type:complete
MDKKQRPVILNIINDGTNGIEYFQNNTLRAIIKMQHDLLIISFKNYLEKRKIEFINFSDSRKINLINSIFLKDTAYKNIVLGHVLGHFSIQEYHFYLQNSSEINKRIIKVIQKRIQDSIIEI